MKVFLPETSDEEGVSTSFTFNSDDDQKNFVAWLSSLNMEYMKTKIPVIEDGKMRYQTCVVVQQNEEVEAEEEEEIIEEAEPEEEVVAAPKKAKKPKKKAVLEEEEEDGI